MHHYCLLLYQTGLYLQVFLRIQSNNLGYKKTPSVFLSDHMKVSCFHMLIFNQRTVPVIEFGTNCLMRQSRPECCPGQSH